MKTFKESEIDEKYDKVCPYCMNESNKDVCCGEVHFEPGYEIDGEMYLASEVKIIKESL